MDGVDCTLYVDCKWHKLKDNPMRKGRSHVHIGR